MQQTSQCKTRAKHSKSTLFHLVGFDEKKRLWVRPFRAEPIVTALLDSSLSQRDVQAALEHAWLGVGVFHGGIDSPVISTFVASSTDQLSHERTLKVDAIVFGNNRAKIYVDQEGLCIRSKKIFAFAKRRLRLLGGSVELG